MKSLLKIVLWIVIIYLLIKYCPVLFAGCIALIVLFPAIAIIGLIWFIARLFL